MSVQLVTSQCAGLAKSGEYFNIAISLIEAASQFSVSETTREPQLTFGRNTEQNPRRYHSGKDCQLCPSHERSLY